MILSILVLNPRYPETELAVGQGNARWQRGGGHCALYLGERGPIVLDSNGQIDAIHVGVGLAMNVGVAVAVAVFVGVWVALGVLVGIAVAVAVGVWVAVGVSLR